VPPTASRRLAPAILLLAGAALWSTAFAGRFQYDDFGAILGAGGNDPPLSVARSLTSIRPLTRLTFALERRLFGSDPAGYHLLSLTLHLASTLLLRRIVRRLGGVPAGEPSPVADAAALLFLVHPLASEAVTYLSGRASLLSACVSLAAVERWLAWRDGEGAAARASSCAAFALALLAKETAAILPLALLLVDGVRGGVGRGREPLAARGRALAPHLLTLTLFFAAASVTALYRRLLAHSLAMRPPLENLAVQPRVALEALRLYLAPWRSTIDHDLRAEALGSSLAVGLSTLLVALLLLVAWRGYRKRSLAGFGMLWFFVHLLPTCSLVARNDLLSERNLYLPAAGLAVAVAGLAAATLRVVPGPLARRLALVGAAAVLALLAFATLRRNALYVDPVALWSDAVRKAPEKARPHANLGWSLYVAGQTDEAIAEYRIALRLDPGDGLTRENLARAWQRKKRAALDGEGSGHLTAPGSPKGE